MLNYIKSEIYRIFHKRSTYLFIAICSLLLVSSNVVLAVVNQADTSFRYATTDFSLSNFMTSQMIVYILCISVSGMIFGGEHVNHTMKNSISYGVSRGTIYFGKLIVQVLFAILAFTIIFSFHAGSAYLLLEHSKSDMMKLLLQTIGAVVPFFLFAMAATNCFYFIFESNGLAIGSSVGLMVGLPMVSSLLGMKFELFAKLNSILPMNLINGISYDFQNVTMTLAFETDPYLKYWLAGIIQMLIMVVLGIVFFRKKEIK